MDEHNDNDNDSNSTLSTLDGENIMDQETSSSRTISTQYSFIDLNRPLDVEENITNDDTASIRTMSTQFSGGSDTDTNTIVVTRVRSRSRSSSNTNASILQEEYTFVAVIVSEWLDGSKRNGLLPVDPAFQADSTRTIHNAIFLEIGRNRTDRSKSEATKYFKTVVGRCVRRTEELHMIVDIDLLSQFVLELLIARQYYFLDKSGRVKTDDRDAMYGRVIHEVKKYVHCTKKGVRLY